MIDAYRQDVQRFPDFLSLRRRKCLQCAMWSRNGPREVFEEYVGKDVYDEYMAAVEASKG